MDLSYWLMLLKAPQLGIVGFYKALKYFSSPQDIFNANYTTLKNSKLFKSTTINYLQKGDSNIIIADLNWQQKDNCHIITIIDKSYPEQLKQITDPPPILYVRGDISCLKKPQIAIVGSRNPTPSGKQNAHKFAYDLANLGIIITSGMATGIDANAHIGALEAGAQTIAVCGTGLDRVYPAKHKALAQQISTTGALVSEFFIGTAPIANNFPKRNRIISALSLGTLVVEASIKSGTMITARLAAEQGREVFAIPGAITNLLSKGCHHLIKQGAKLVETTTDITQELPLKTRDVIKIQKDNDIYPKNTSNISSVLLKYLSYNAMTIDDIVEKSNLSPQIVTQELLLLELSGTVAKIDGFRYVLVN